MRVEGGLDRAHGGQFHGIAVAFQVGDLEAADAVFGADRSVKFMHQVVDAAFDRVAFLLMVSAGSAGHREYVVMQVAVAQMAEAVDAVAPDPGQRRACAIDELWHAAQWHRDVMR